MRRARNHIPVLIIYRYCCISLHDVFSPLRDVAFHYSQFMSNALQINALAAVASASGWYCTSLLLGSQCNQSQTQALQACSPPLVTSTKSLLSTTVRQQEAPPPLPYPKNCEPTCWLRLAVSNLAVTDQTQSEVSAVCSQIASLMNEQFVPSTAELLTPFRWAFVIVPTEKQIFVLEGPYFNPILEGRP